MSRKGLGAILREADLISEGQLRDALSAQKTAGRTADAARTAGEAKAR